MSKMAELSGEIEQNLKDGRKKPCPYYVVVPGTGKRCWIEPGMKCPKGVRCEPGVQVNSLVLVSNG